jgi:hypothetical protein
MKRIVPYRKQLFTIAADKKLWLRVLGEVGKHQIWLIRTRENVSHGMPRLLIVGGFHGEERGGPLAILKWLSMFDINNLRADVSFIPIVNPEGFDEGKRYNSKNEKSNCGFCHPESGDKPSKEGVILMRQMPMLKMLSKDGFMSLHEDVNSKEFYLYTFEHSDEPGKFTEVMKDELKRHFDKALDGEVVSADATNSAKDKKVTAKDGVVFKLCDGSFEDWLFHEGVPRCIVTETPGTDKLQDRVDAGVALINRFINISVEMKAAEKKKKGAPTEPKE